MFETESGTPPGVDLDATTDRMKIRQAVQNGEVEEAIDKVNDMNPEVSNLLTLGQVLSQKLLSWEMQTRCCPATLEQEISLALHRP